MLPHTASRLWTVGALQTTLHANRHILLSSQVTHTYGAALRIQPFLEFSTASQGVRYAGFKAHDYKMRKELFRRRLAVGPEPIRHRGIWQNWNYDAELYAFGQRLGENFSSESLRLAFIHPSYAAQEVERRKELGIENPLDENVSSVHHTSLKTIGEAVLTLAMPALCRFNFPYFPEEGISGVAKFLCDEKMLAYVSRNLGTSDLIMCAELSPTEKTLSETLVAIIGALTNDSGSAQACRFILDFILSQILEKDINDYLHLTNPMGVLAHLLRAQGKGDPESRMLRKSGECTVVAVYSVGIYSDQELVGQCFGETVLIAEEMAARDALRRLFRTKYHNNAVRFGEDGMPFSFQAWSDIPNVPLADWSEQRCREVIAERAEAQSRLSRTALRA